jgi:hypothetical protein
VVSEAEATTYVPRHPELFSSKRAFYALGSPIQSGVDNLLLIFPPGCGQVGRD